MPAFKYEIAIDNSRNLVKIGLDKDARHPTGWDFVLLDVHQFTDQSITFATTEMKGYGTVIKETYDKACGANQYAEGEVGTHSADYHIDLHVRMEQAFGITQHRLSADGPTYLHEHWSKGKGRIADVFKFGIKPGIFDFKLVQALLKLNIATLQFEFD
ncbi:MAG: hypothetical protein R3F55_22065 [Alphaproteobacteria bacterium]